MVRKFYWLALPIILLSQQSMGSHFEDDDKVSPQKNVKPPQVSNAQIIKFQAVNGEELQYNPEDRTLTALRGQSILPHNQPSIFRKAKEHSTEAIEALMKCFIVRVVRHENGECELKLSGRLRGGMQRALPIIEKGMDKINRVVVPIIGGTLGALGIQGTQEALKDHSNLPNQSVTDQMMDPVIKDQTLEEAVPKVQTRPIEQAIPVPQSRPIQTQSVVRDIPIPKTKPVYGEAKTETYRAPSKNIYRNPVQKKEADSTVQYVPRGITGFPDFPSETSRYGGGLLDDINKKYQAHLVKKNIAETIATKRQWEVDKINTGKNNLNLNGPHPGFIDELLQSLPRIEALITFDENVLSHPATFLTDYLKNIKSWTEAPKYQQNIETTLTDQGLKDSGLENWAFKNVWWYLGQRPQCPRTLTTEEQNVIFSSWTGENPNSLGLDSGKDLIAIEKIEEVGGKYGGTYELTISSNLIPHTVVNAEILEILKYMGENNIPYGTTPFVHDVKKGTLGTTDTRNGQFFPSFIEDIGTEIEGTLDYFKGRGVSQYTGITKDQEQQIIGEGQNLYRQHPQNRDSQILKESYKNIVLYPPLAKAINYFIGQGSPQYTSLSQNQGDKILDLAMDNCFNNNIKNPDSGPLKEAYKQVVYLTPVKHTLEWYGRDKSNGGAGIHYFKALGPKYEGRVISVAQELSYRFDLKPDSAVIAKAYDQVMSGELRYVFDYHVETTKAKQYRDLYPIQAQKVIQLGLTSMKNSGTSEPDTAPLSRAFNQISKKGWSPHAVAILQTTSNPRVLYNTKGIESVFNKYNGLVYPLLNEEITSENDILVNGYNPTETHINIGHTVLESLGDCGIQILEEVIGIPKQAHANPGVIIGRGCQALAASTGLALDTMLSNGELTKSIQIAINNKIDGIYNHIELIQDIVQELVRKGLGKESEAKKINDVISTTVNANPQDFESDSDDEEEATLEHKYKYHDRIRHRATQDPKGHNFPHSFDKIILRENPIVQKDKSLLFRKAGELNGRKGFFEIGLNPKDKTIFHRCFRGE